MPELWQLSASQLAQLIRAGKASARDAAQSALLRLDAVNPQINAIVEHRPEWVLQQADAIDHKLARGEAVGPLAGVPVTIKINLDQAGFATTNGTRLQRDLVAGVDNPAVGNRVRADAVLLGRSNAPAFALRWFTSNLLHGSTRNPRDPTRTPGGSSGGGAAGVACGIGHIALGTDTGGSVRYPAYACGIHGLRPTLGRVASYNASSPERAIGFQLMSVTGPIARTVGDLRLALAALSAPNSSDPWWVPAPLEGPPVPRRAALCLRPGGIEVAEEVATAVLDAGQRLTDAGWSVEEIADTPPVHEAGEILEALWFGQGFAELATAAAQDGDPGALAVVAGIRHRIEHFHADVIPRCLVRRATLTRQWLQFLSEYPVLIMPVSAELPFPDGLDLTGDASFRRVWHAQSPLMCVAPMGLPALSVTTRLVGAIPVGVQIIAGHFREDLCLLAGEAIEAAGTPASPIDPKLLGAP